MIGRIRKCFLENRVLYTQHARDEMRSEELGPIREREVFEAVQTGEVIESYKDDKPYPSALVVRDNIAGSADPPGMCSR